MSGEQEKQLTLIAKQRILPSETMLTNKTRASESSLLAKVSKDLVAMTAPVI